MASIKKLAEGKYFVRASKGTGKDRLQLNKTVRGPKKAARKVGRDFETMLDSGYSPEEITLTFQKYFEKWLKAVRRTVSLRTFEDYRETISRYALETLASVKLASIKTHHIQSIYNRMLDEGLSATTVRNLHRPLHACFKYAVDKDYKQKNPLSGIDLPAKVRRAFTVLSPDEAHIFTAECQTARNGLIFEFALETGMRPEEYRALRWRDVNFAGNTVSVNQVVVYARKGGGFTFEKCKTAKSRRLIPISQNLRDRLMVHRREQNEYRLQLNVSYASHDLVFANEVGNPFTLTNLRRRYFKPIIDKCGFNIRLYDLRHTMATLLLIMGENPKVVADRLGHSSVVITLDTYSHVLPHIQEAATAKLDNVLRMVK